MSESRRFSEDLLAMLVAGTVLSVSLLVTVLESRGVFSESVVSGGAPSWRNPMKSLVLLPAAWEVHPFESGWEWLRGAAGAGLLITVVMSAVMWLGRGSEVRFWQPCVRVFLLSLLAYVLAEQKVVKYYGLEYALWALLIGLLISNTIGVSKVLSAGARTELYMKTGLVLLGAEVLFGKLLALGLPGICVSWVVTPVVLIVTFWFGQRVLRMESAALNMVISADMSVCGVSAAIATAAACRAKKEELTTAVGISLAFTVMMMVAMPPLIQAMGLGPVVGGAWVGGTIDSTGAVGAAGAMLGKEAEVVATTIKMIQNMLIGVVAFGVAVYWVTCVERTSGVRPDISEIWRRFPRFILGFLGASVLVSVLYENLSGGPDFVKAVVDGGTKTVRSWCFCMAFVSIGLETNLRTLAKFLRGGKPLTLYVCGQLLNLVLSLLMSLLMFEVVFPGAADVLRK